MKLTIKELSEIIYSGLTLKEYNVRTKHFAYLLAKDIILYDKRLELINKK